MNRFTASFLLLPFALALAVNAQQPAQSASPAPPPVADRHQPNPAREARMLSKRLNLTPDQASQVQPILADRQQRIGALMSNTALDPKSMHQQRRAILQDTDQKLNAILTPAQQQQWATMKSEHHHGRGEAPAPAPSL